jgi:hypothetical protein
MSVHTFVRELADRGVLLEAEGTDLHYRAPRGVLTPSLLEAVKAKKSQLVTFIKETDTELRKEAEKLRLDLGIIRELAGPDWPVIASDLELARAYMHAVRTRRLREAGERPPEWNQPAHCVRCGPVWLWESIEVQGCPWCMNRFAGRPIPRPTSNHDLDTP